MVRVRREAMCAAILQGQLRTPCITAQCNMRHTIASGSEEFCHNTFLLWEIESGIFLTIEHVDRFLAHLLHVKAHAFQDTRGYAFSFKH